MDQLRRDPITGRWVIVSSDKPYAPGDFEISPEPKEKGICPFCYGHEAMTPPEIQAHREGSTPANAPGWSTRVVANKYPALIVEGAIDSRGDGMFDLFTDVG